MPDILLLSRSLVLIRNAGYFIRAAQHVDGRWQDRARDGPAGPVRGQIGRPCKRDHAVSGTQPAEFQNQSFPNFFFGYTTKTEPDKTGILNKFGGTRLP